MTMEPLTVDVDAEILNLYTATIPAFYGAN